MSYGNDPQGCADSGCIYPASRARGGQRTNGGCRCGACPHCRAMIRPVGGHHRDGCPEPTWIPEPFRAEWTMGNDGRLVRREVEV
jgi:hypothetical protein